MYVYVCVRVRVYHLREYLAYSKTYVLAITIITFGKHLVLNFW